MSFSITSWLKNLKANVRGTRRSKPRSAVRPSRSPRPRVELLEDRLAPALMVTEGASGVTNGQIQRFNESTGALIDTFVPPGSGGLQNPRGAAFGQDGNLYVADVQGNEIRKYNGTTGASIGIFASES